MSTRMIAAWLLIGLITALTVTCTDQECVRKHEQAAAQAQLENLQATENGCTDKIISCGFDHICPYPGQHIDVATTGDPGCSSSICICRCHRTPVVSTGTKTDNTQP